MVGSTIQVNNAAAPLKMREFAVTKHGLRDVQVHTIPIKAGKEHTFGLWQKVKAFSGMGARV